MTANLKTRTGSLRPPRNPAGALADCPQPLNPDCNCPGCRACIHGDIPMTVTVIRGRINGSLSRSGF